MTQAPPVTLADFLRARFDEDAAEARENQHYQENVYEAAGWWDCDRVLAEVEAKRRIVENISGYLRSHISDDFSGEHLGEDVLELLALPYAGHSEYRSEWRP